MAKRPKTEQTTERTPEPPTVCLWMVREGGGFVESASCGITDADMNLVGLECECGQVSRSDEWPEEAATGEVCACPHCGSRYALTVPRGEELIDATASGNGPLTDAEADALRADVDGMLVVMESRAEPEPEQKQEQSTPDGEVIGEVSPIQALTDEWMDLEFRLEQLDDEKREFMAGWKKECTGASKRIREIRSELSNLKRGISRPADEADDGARQLPMFE